MASVSDANGSWRNTPSESQPLVGVRRTGHGILPLRGRFLLSRMWETLLQLARTEALQEWTLIGGQMVLLHALEHGTTPIRLSTDIDVVVNARVVVGGVRNFVKSLESLGFSLAGVSPDGIAHRYRRERASIDVLAPEGLGNRADLTTTPPNRTLEVPGGTQALNRTELLPVQFAGEEGHVPRPSLLGAIVALRV